MLWKHQIFTVIVNKPFSVQKCLEIYWVSLLLLIKDILLTSKFLFDDFELYIDDLYNTIILHFQFCLIRIHQIITSRFFYEKYLTENGEKIEDSFEFSQYWLQKIWSLPLRNQVQRVCTDSGNERWRRSMRDICSVEGE